MNTQPATPIARTTSALDPEHDRNPHRRIQAATVRQMCGGISDMTLWRWLDNHDLDFPRPIYIGRRRYWKEAEIVAWLEAREVAA
ncbi:helix-turn-helix transcriptional regulator [Oceaniglobus ichthyenteri]|uniref:helix-turn-helix transcriptional regulator n=1 Tax=Oceaniglobus ichthyenteri TaxID=2136177 RepID=UPI000D37FE3A|nr:AlpA family phage regulatory protein [Oceaniglobus ichthyenteri]